MSKNDFVLLTKGKQNHVFVFEGITVAHVAWLDNPWLIIENGETFEEASKREFVPIAAYHTRDDLYKAIKAK